MAKPNAVEEIMVKVLARKEGDGRDIPENVARLYVKSQIAALARARLAIVPHDWNHREEDWSLESVSEWLGKAKEG